MSHSMCLIATALLSSLFIIVTALNVLHTFLSQNNRSIIGMVEVGFVRRSNQMNTHLYNSSNVEITSCFSSLYWSSLPSLSLCNPFKYFTNFTLFSNKIFTTSGGCFLLQFSEIFCFAHFLDNHSPYLD